MMLSKYWAIIALFIACKEVCGHKLLFRRHENKRPGSNIKPKRMISGAYTVEDCAQACLLLSSIRCTMFVVRGGKRNCLYYDDEATDTLSSDFNELVNAEGFTTYTMNLDLGPKQTPSNSDKTTQPPTTTTIPAKTASRLVATGYSVLFQRHENKRPASYIKPKRMITGANTVEACAQVCLQLSSIQCRVFVLREGAKRCMYFDDEANLSSDSNELVNADGFTTYIINIKQGLLQKPSASDEITESPTTTATSTVTSSVSGASGNKVLFRRHENKRPRSNIKPKRMITGPNTVEDCAQVCLQLSSIWCSMFVLREGGNKCMYYDDKATGPMSSDFSELVDADGFTTYTFNIGRGLMQNASTSDQSTRSTTTTTTSTETTSVSDAFGYKVLFRKHENKRPRPNIKPKKTISGANTVEDCAQHCLQLSSVRCTMFLVRKGGRKCTYYGNEATEGLSSDFSELVNADGFITYTLNMDLELISKIRSSG